MARGVNKVILMGHCGQDPQIKELPSGDKLVNFSLATNESWKDRQTGESRERTEWHRVVMFGRLADVAAQYLRSPLCQDSCRPQFFTRVAVKDVRDEPLFTRAQRSRAEQAFAAV